MGFMRSSRLIFGGIFLLVMGFIIVQGGSFLIFAVTPAVPGSEESVIVEIQKGQGPAEVSSILATRKVVSDARQFQLYGKLTRTWPKLKAGEYKVSPGMRPSEVFAVITSGISVPHPITVREGENMYEVAADLESKGLVAKDRFLAICRDPAFISGLGLGKPQPGSLEGYLFPETYHFNKTMTPEDMARQMVRKFAATWEASHEARARELGLSRHQVVTLASIVEKETGAPEERAMISSVFHNRLRKRMRLQSDPTTVYGMWERYTGNIRKADLMESTPYNTYAIPALPVGPISNPGKDAIDAALFPVKSENLFFVSRNDGTHVFTRTFEDHSAAVRKHQLDPKARAGKSWRDLSKRRSGS